MSKNHDITDTLSEVVAPARNRRLHHINYKWIALSNTTLGTFMAGLDSSIVLISLPAIFRGIHIDPLAPDESDYLLWTIMGYGVVTATLLVTFGRISDMFGRVRLYNLGFAIFAVGSVLLYLVQGTGNAAALQIVIFRLVQAVGGAFLMSNSAAILTDVFPPLERGMAMGINQIARLSGELIGLVAGGLLAAISWRAVFLVSVPFSVGGSIWAYLMLHETATIRKHQRVDVPGNILFAVGLTILLVGMTYGLQPYGGSSMGWTSPRVIAFMVIGILAIVAFVFVERRSPDPMFRLDLFKIRMFAAGNVAGFLASLARGGLTFMLIVWLQGIWLPLHGYRFEDTPLWAGIYMLPLTVGFFLMGPLCGYLSDRYGARTFSSAGMVITSIGFIGLMFQPANFNYLTLALFILIIGMGMGMFAAPNTTAIMNSVPAEHRGIASGMRSTCQNTASIFSISWVFTMVTIGFAATLPITLYKGLTECGIPSAAARTAAQLPPTGALFAAFLGYNPMTVLLPRAVLHNSSAATQSKILGTTFFPGLIGDPFERGLKIAFGISAALALLAAVASLLRGKRYIRDLDHS